MIVIGWVGYQVVTKLIAIKNKHREIVERDLLKKEEYDKLVENLAKTQAELEELKTQTSKDLDKIKDSMGEHIDDADTDHTAVTTAIRNLEALVEKHELRVVSLEKSILHMREHIDLLFTCDKEYARTFILEGYNKYVKKEHSISLVALQGLESIYNKYLSENSNTNDEFLARIMRELRNLPTSRDDT